MVTSSLDPWLLDLPSLVTSSSIYVHYQLPSSMGASCRHPWLLSLQSRLLTFSNSFHPVLLLSFFIQDYQFSLSCNSRHIHGKSVNVYDFNWQRSNVRNRFSFVTIYRQVWKVGQLWDSFHGSSVFEPTNHANEKNRPLLGLQIYHPVRIRITHFYTWVDLDGLTSRN